MSIGNTYWKSDFQNGYTIGVATTEADAKQYATVGFKRIDRSCALRFMSNRGDSATQICVTVNGDPTWNRFETARVIRKGMDLHTCP